MREWHRGRVYSRKVPPRCPSTEDFKVSKGILCLLAPLVFMATLDQAGVIVPLSPPTPFLSSLCSHAKRKFWGVAGEPERPEELVLVPRLRVQWFCPYTVLLLRVCFHKDTRFLNRNLIQYI